MTLDEAILHAEDVADTPCFTDEEARCYAEHRQLAKWLKELRDYRERMPSYEAGYNDAKREIALSGEYERAYERGKEDAKRALQEPTGDMVSRQAVHEAIEKWAGSMAVLVALPTREVRPLLDSIHKLPSVNPQKWIPVSDKYEHHIDHTDCIWYGSGDCPVTCAQYRDGWNDAMDYVFKNGKGYQPYRRDGI